MGRQKKKNAPQEDEAVGLEASVSSQERPRDLRGAIKTELTLIPSSHSENELQAEEERRVLETHVRDTWQELGYYKDHPNNNSAHILQITPTSELPKPHKLGPILKQYGLFVNSQPETRTLLIQYPNAEDVYRAHKGQKPLEVRIKPKTGLVEIDIPLNIHDGYDKGKGLEYGQALRKSQLLQQGGSYGLAGGMGAGAQPTKADRRAPQPEGPSVEKLLDNFDDANNKGHVMNKVTLGGMVVPLKDGDPIYMVATFKDAMCTWSKLDAMVQVRLQFSHLDALHEQEKFASRAEKAQEEKNVGKPEETQAKAVNLAVKSTEGHDEQDLYGGMSNTAKLLKAMRDEPWQRLKWVDQDDEESWQIHDGHLIYQDPESAPHLISEVTQGQYLDAISCPRIDPIKQGKKIITGHHSSGTASETSDQESFDSDFGETEVEEEEEEEEETLPPGVLLPEDPEKRVFVEMCCRLIAASPANSQARLLSGLTQRYRTDPSYIWLKARDRNHAYFQWRVAENRAGRGYTPEWDVDVLG